MLTLTMSPKGYAVTRSFEGRSLVAYRDEAGVWTIGFGQTNDDASVLGFTIKSGVRITEAQCEALLQASMVRLYVPPVNKILAAATKPVAQPQADASYDFQYNTGAAGRASWMKSFLAGNIPAVQSLIMEWNRGGGQVLAGLTRRRAREWDMIDTGDYGSEGSNAPLDMDTGKPVATAVAPASVASPAAPANNPGAGTPWLTRMDSILGLYETAGGPDNATILAMAQQCGGQIAKTYNSAAIAWCALTVNWCLVTTGLKGDDSLWALDVRKIGTKLSGPAVGAIASMARTGGGHTFLVRGRTAAGEIVGTGGNQSNMVCDDAFNPAVLSYNWPAGVALPAKVGIGTLPVVTPRPHTHVNITALPGFHPATAGTVVPAHLDGTPGMMKLGDVGDAVKELQLMLMTSGYDVGGADGDFGAKTDAAVRNFQKAHPQLDVTGIADPATRAALTRQANGSNALASTAKTAAGVGTAVTAGDATFSQHLHTFLYVGIGAVTAAVLVYIAWKYRDEIVAWFKQGGL